MLTIYYCSDPGMLVNHEQKFLKEHPNSVVFTPNSYQELFSNLENNLFFTPTAYCIKNAVLLGNNWTKWANKETKLSDNVNQINNFITLLTELKHQGIAVLITVHEDNLLNHRVITKLLQLTNNTDHQVKKLNFYDKKKYLDQLIQHHQLELDRLAKIYFYELFPNNAEIINEIFHQLTLLGEKKISLTQLQQIIGQPNTANFYQIIDAWLLGHHGEWVDLFNKICQNNEQAEELWNILLYKFSELYHYQQLRQSGYKPAKIMELMNKEAFMLRTYEKTLQTNRKLSTKINHYLLKLIGHSKKIRRYMIMTPQVLKMILINF